MDFKQSDINSEMKIQRFGRCYRSEKLEGYSGDPPIQPHWKKQSSSYESNSTTANATTTNFTSMIKVDFSNYVPKYYQNQKFGS